MTGRYAFRWGATGYTIGSQDPWGVPLDETFFPELLQASRGVFQYPVCYCIHIAFLNCAAAIISLGVYISMPRVV